AEDALFTYELLADPDLPSDPRLGQLWRQVSCNAPDEFTLLCELSEPFAPFLSFTSIGLLPKHILEGMTAAEIFDSPFNQAPVGTGPFRLSTLNQAEAILKADPTYYGERPAIDEIEFRFFPNPSTAAAALSRGEVQGLLLGPSASQEDFDLLTSTEGLRAYTSNRTLILMLFLNNSQPPFDDSALREAVALSVNVDDVISNLLGGRAVHADSPIVPGTWAYNPQLEPRPHDPDKARELLDEAGWETTDDGVRQKDGNELRVSLMTDQDPKNLPVDDTKLVEKLPVKGEQIEITCPRCGAEDACGCDLSEADVPGAWAKDLTPIRVQEEGKQPHEMTPEEIQNEVFYTELARCYDDAETSQRFCYLALAGKHPAKLSHFAATLALYQTLGKTWVHSIGPLYKHLRPDSMFKPHLFAARVWRICYWVLKKLKVPKEIHRT
ncbi:hypothetical protein LCGC14_2531540, partial [marine sediment metagenome]